MAERGARPRLVQVNLKAADHERVGRFWADALGWDLAVEGPVVVNVEPPGVEWPDPAYLFLDVIQVADLATVAHRTHLDLASASLDDQAATIARLEGLGATRADIGQGDVPWVVMADPEGALFCVLEPREVYADTGPVAAAVVSCADPERLAAFWSEATDWVVHELSADGARLRSPQGVGPWLELVRTSGEPHPGYRGHLDLLPVAGDDQAAQVARLEALGARRADVGQPADASWVVMADPQGEEFCVLSPRS